MPKRTRIAVFIDYQNCYGAARRAFHQPDAPARCGHFVPQVMASVLAAKEGVGAYSLDFVGVYCGMPNPRRDRRTAAARQRQLAAWRKRGGVTAVTRNLRYPHDWPREKAQEKGIDVKLAIDAITFAVKGLYDVGIIASCDRDLAPLVEALLDLRHADGVPRVALIGWRGRDTKIGMAGRLLTYHWLDEHDYHAMQDLTDYDV